jgi:ribosomal protein L11 methyltransferase
VLREEDWANAWKAHFRVHKVGTRVVIKPSWQSYAVAAEEVVVELDPGMAFGTGLHPTTRTCLEALEKHLTPEMNVLDLGTGSGILAIAAAKLGAASVLAMDIDPVAVKTARANVRINRVQRKVKVRRGTLPLPHPDHKSDLILANIIAKVIMELAHALITALKPGGILIASGIIQEHQAEVENHLLLTGALPLGAIREGDWLTLVYQAPLSFDTPQ